MEAVLPWMHGEPHLLLVWGPQSAAGIEEAMATEAHQEYTSVREMGPVFFVVKPGHVFRDVERVVGGEADRYEILEKLDVAAEVATELDARS